MLRKIDSTKKGERGGVARNQEKAWTRPLAGTSTPTQEGKRQQQQQPQTPHTPHQNDQQGGERNEGRGSERRGDGRNLDRKDSFAERDNNHNRERQTPQQHDREDSRRDDRRDDRRGSFGGGGGGGFDRRSSYDRSEDRRDDRRGSFGGGGFDRRGSFDRRDPRDSPARDPRDSPFDKRDSFDRDNRRGGGDDRDRRDDRRGSFGGGGGGTPSRRTSSRMEIITKEPEVGFVVLIKDSYGFIKTFDRNEDLFFSLRDAPRDIGTDSEVKFMVASEGPNSNKFHAVEIEILPRGTIKVQEVIQEKLQGIVIEGLQRHEDGEFGIIQVTNNNNNNNTTDQQQQQEAKEGKEEKGEEEEEDEEKATTRYRFVHKSLRDTMRIVPQPSDIVEFDVLLDRRRRVKVAWNVKISKMGGTRETGIIESVKDGFGFIECCERLDSMYFSFRDVVAYSKQGQPIDVHEEVEFSVIKDPKGRLQANRIKMLPPKTVSFSVTLEKVFHGIVTQPFISRQGLGTIQIKAEETDSLSELLAKSIPGYKPQTQQQEDETTEQQSTTTTTTTPDSSQSPSLTNKLKNIRKENQKTFKFSSADVKESLLGDLFIGDEVSFEVVIDKRTQEKTATHINLTKHFREIGVVKELRQGFGVVQATAGGELFLKATDIQKNSKNVRIGCQVEYSITIDPQVGNKRRAVQVLVKEVLSVSE